MASLVEYVRKYVGLAAEVKPTEGANGERIPPGSEFLELDTSAKYVWSGTAWYAINIITSTS